MIGLQVCSFFACINYFNYKHNKQTKHEIIFRAYVEKNAIKHVHGQDCNIQRLRNFCENGFACVHQ